MAYGLHPNAEIDLGTTQCKYMFDRLNELIPKETVYEPGETNMGNRNVEFYYNKIFFEMNLKEKMFSLVEIKDRITEIGPF